MSGKKVPENRILVFVDRDDRHLHRAELFSALCIFVLEKERHLCYNAMYLCKNVNFGGLGNDECKC